MSLIPPNRPVAASTSPGGATTNVQYNASGAFAGDAGFTYNSSTHVLTATGFVGSLTGNASTASTAGTFNNNTQGIFASASAVSNVSGDFTDYTIIFNNTKAGYTAGGNYDNTTGIYASIPTGMQQVNVTVQLTGLASTNTVATLQLIRGGTPAAYTLYQGNVWDMSFSNICIISGSMAIPFANNDSLFVRIEVGGSSKVVGIGANTYLSTLKLTNF